MLSFQCNIEKKDTESQYVHSTDHVLTAKEFKTAGSSCFNHATSAGVRIIMDLSSCGPDNDREERLC